MNGIHLCNIYKRFHICCLPLSPHSLIITKFAEGLEMMGTPCHLFSVIFWICLHFSSSFITSHPTTELLSHNGSLRGGGGQKDVLRYFLKRLKMHVFTRVQLFNILNSMGKIMYVYCINVQIYASNVEQNRLKSCTFFRPV